VTEQDTTPAAEPSTETPATTPEKAEKKP
jgi:hypothetical protein